MKRAAITLCPQHVYRPINTINTIVQKPIPRHIPPIRTLHAYTREGSLNSTRQLARPRWRTQSAQATHNPPARATSLVKQRTLY